MEQIITGEGDIVANLDDHIKNIGIWNIGADYRMIAIIGCQSSGKSTLLNLLFGTTFATMNDKIGRQQTTKGVHAAKATDSNILVFDVEGSDSRERGDSEALFERKSALFALALSEVLVINMWESDLGRYNAANIPLLRTVFEVNVQLFLAQNESKSKILFVIRDCTHPNFSAICSQIKTDMENIWSEINKPKELQDKVIEDFFDFDFFSIHHMRFEKLRFDEDIMHLKDMFCNHNNEKYLFAEESKKNVPGDALAQYIRNLWIVINENKDLNIPSQRLMISHFMCEERENQLFTGTTKILNQMVAHPLNLETPVPKFGEICNNEILKALETYKKDSWKYSADAVSVHEESLISRFKTYLQPLYNKNCIYWGHHTFNTFSSDINIENYCFTVNGKWRSEMESKLHEYQDSLSKEIESCSIPIIEKRYDPQTFYKRMNSLIDSYQGILIKRLHENTIPKFLRTFEEQAGLILKESDDTMWDDLKSVLSKSSEAAKSEIDLVLSTNTNGALSNSNIIESFEKRLIELVEESAAYILLKMKTAFDKKFKYEDNGRPRVWGARDDIVRIYTDARNKGIRVLQLYEICRLQNKPTMFFSNQKSKETLDNFDRIISHTYEEARAAILAQSEKSSIPSWAWIVLLVLGWDKLLKVVSNPILFALILFIILSAFFLKQLGLLGIAKDKLIEKIKNLVGVLDNTQNQDKASPKNTSTISSTEKEIMNMTKTNTVSEFDIDQKNEN